MKRLCSLLLASSFVALAHVPAQADPGVSATEIVVGQSAALSGPAMALGTGMRTGMEAYFNEVNAAGGINGRKIRFVARDDGYEPEKAIAATKALLDEDKVFALVGEVGTPTSKAAVPIAEAAKAPFIGPFTGAEFLRNPYNPYVVNVRASYYQETERMAQYLVDVKKLTKIACFYQNDGYGEAGLAGIKQALERRKMELCATGNYERNTVAVKTGLMAIRKGEPEAIVMIGAYKPCAEFIKLGRKSGLDKALYLNVSFVGTAALKTELGDEGEGVIITQVVPLPTDAKVAVVDEYQKALKKHFPSAEQDFVSLEGFLAAKLFCEVLRKVEGEPTREKLLATIKSVGKWDLGGVTLVFGENDHQGMDEVFLTHIKDKSVVSLE